MATAASHQVSFKHALGRAAEDTVNLMVAVSSLMAAWAFDAQWVLVLGGMLYALLVVGKLASPRFWNELEVERMRQRLPPPIRFADSALGATVSALASALARATRLIVESPKSVKAYVTPLLASLEALEGRAAEAATRADRIGTFLRAQRRAAVQHEIRRFAELTERSLDPTAEREYARARAAREEQLRALEELGHSHERLTAMLARILATIEALPPRIFRLQLLDEESDQMLREQLDEELERMAGELGASEMVLASVHENVAAFLEEGAAYVPVPDSQY